MTTIHRIALLVATPFMWWIRRADQACSTGLNTGTQCAEQHVPQRHIDTFIETRNQEHIELLNSRASSAAFGVTLVAHVIVLVAPVCGAEVIANLLEIGADAKLGMATIGMVIGMITLYPATIKRCFALIGAIDGLHERAVARRRRFDLALSWPE